MRGKEYLRLLIEVIKLIEEGVHVVDAEGITVFYSSKMAELEQSKVEDVLGKPFRQVFSHIPVTESTLYRAINKGEPTFNLEQRYANKFGKEIITVNSTVPVEVDGKIFAAIEIASDNTTYKHMRDKILELQENVSYAFDIVGQKRNLDKEEDEDIPLLPKDLWGKEGYTFPDLVGKNKEFVNQVEIAKKAASSELAVFIIGETGTGKELFAQSIHYGSKRAGKPFIAQNCAAFPENLLEGIIFGTSKGTFIGAEERVGLIEQANGGTLLLDELSAMPYELQSKLLRALQENYIRRIGGKEDIPVNIRVIATVNSDPAKLVASGKLRRDLYYRLSIININLPVLRNRADDIELLANYFLEKHAEEENKEFDGFTEAAINKLLHYDYPGNVRELENAILSAIAMTSGESIISEDKIKLNGLSDNFIDTKTTYDHMDMPLSDYLEQMEKNIILKAIASRRGNISQAADMLGMKRQTLQHKIKKYNI